MFSFKRSAVALVGVLLLAASIASVMPLASHGQGKTPFGQRQFYITQQQAYTGSQALTACAAGYHMASMWEIHDPSNLRYNTTLGLTTADSGSGPPTITQTGAGIFNRGWIRTGARSAPDGPPGTGNCSTWTSDAPANNGTVVGLLSDWNFPLTSFTSPWTAATPPCSAPQQVWCVED